MPRVPQCVQKPLETRIKSALIGILWRIAFRGDATRILLRRLGYFLLKVSKVGELGGKAGTLFYPEEPETRISQFAVAERNEVRAGIFPGIGFHRLRNVFVTANRRFTSVIASDKLLISDSADEGPWNLRVGSPTVAGVLRNSDKFVMVKLSATKGDPIPRGILGGTTSPHNWYSWLFDILPTVWLAKKLPPEFADWPMLLPAEGLQKADWLESLNVLEPDRELLEIERHNYRSVDELLWLDSPNCAGPLPMTNRVAARFRIHLSAYRDYKRDFEMLCSRKIPESGLRRRQFPERVFLARNQQGERPYNQDEAISVAEEFGFTPVMLESLSFLETFQLFQNANRLVGPHGAGWTNMIFSGPGTKGLMWTWTSSLVDNWYANVAKVSEVDFAVYVGSTENSNPHHVDIDQLRFRLGNLI